jgi:transposase
MIDGIIVRAHQRSAGVQKTEANQAIRRSRGGLRTKIHALADPLGNPIGFFLSGDETRDLVGADHLPSGLQADTLIGDKAFDAEKHVLMPLAAAGNFFARLKQYRGTATRYDKTRRNFLAAVQLAAAVICLN